MKLFKSPVKKNYTLIMIPFMLVMVLINGCTGRENNKKSFRIGILSGLQWFDRTIDGFKSGMESFGYVDGDNIHYQVEKAHADPAMQREVLKKFVADKVDLILVYPTEASLLAKQMTKGTNIPVVFTNAALEGTALVDSVRQPGGNITGIRYPGPENLIKRLEFLKELIPAAKRVLMFYDPDYPNNPPTLKLLRPAALSLNITLVEVQASSPDTIIAELQRRNDTGEIDLDAVLYLSEIVSTAPKSTKAIAEFAVQHKIPRLSGVMVPGEKGSLLGYSPDPYNMGEEAASLADKILKGIPAGTIPVVSPDSHLHFNYKQAISYGIEVPDGILAQAVEIAR